MSAVRSPSYPSMSLQKAIIAVSKIYEKYRTKPVERKIAAELIGFRVLSGPATKALAALASYGLVERSGKGEIRVTERAKSILYPDKEADRAMYVQDAASGPTLFRTLRERYDDILPPIEGVESFLKREGFNESAVRRAAKAFIETFHYVNEVSEGLGLASEFSDAEESVTPSEMDTQTHSMSLEIIKPEATTLASGEVEWMRNPLSTETYVRLLVTGEMGPKEIANLIKLLEAQKSVLEDN